MTTKSTRKRTIETKSAPPRVVIEDVQPCVSNGRFPVKRTVGEILTVTADVHVDGHDELRAVVHYRRDAEKEWREIEMEPLGNDLWSATIDIEELTPHHYTVEAWVDGFRSWRRDLQKRFTAEQQREVDLAVGAELLAQGAKRASGAEARLLSAAAKMIVDGSHDLETRTRRALEEDLLVVMDRHPDRSRAARADREYAVLVERERARFSAWYEFFPRSTSPDPARTGTFRDCEARLEYVAELGFDVVYLPPIHPIGRKHRKGPNNATTAAAGDLGSPWAIGASEGGHTAIHPDLGTFKDFARLLTRAKELNLEIALDLAYQCAPDHPWVAEHPDWFTVLPDGSIQYAENPPKKYQDIYPINFESDDWRELWNALRDVVLFWIDKGVRIFRVDNPHTKSYAFWEWMIGDVRREHPDVIFLSEAFTRPKVMYRLARLGFSQSYTYFTWRNTREELTKYLTELTTTDLVEFFRPNLWPNTPDILPESLQTGGRPIFAARLLLAATLGANYGIYGPAYELIEGRPLKPGGEEYLDSEKYQVRQWDLDHPDSLRELIKRVNRIRRENLALHDNRQLRFHKVDNETLIAYSKCTSDLENVIVVVVNLDPHHKQSGWLELDPVELGLPESGAYQVHDLLSDARFQWNGPRNFVELDPEAMPGHVLRISRPVRSERDFDYYQ